MTIIYIIIDTNIEYDSTIYKENKMKCITNKIDLDQTILSSTISS